MMFFFPPSLPDRALLPWLGLLGVLPDFFTIRLCLWALSRHRQPQESDLEYVAQAQALVRHGARVILLLRRRRQAGDRQAVGAYQAGVAVGFYGLEQRCLPVSFTPPEGSAWTSGQLHRLRRAGLVHGDAVRQRQIASRADARAGLATSPASGASSAVSIVSTRVP